ncbi:Xaa-Pro peptidase family protein [Mesorhizobium sp.]|uniref:M24 family metallopeptidase n=1 Tax=Mesorhizobium sp. TaxID=1871066 RepID=UPI000FE84D42|nr:Xaa-Pro peptidase family protein [Mesorhizobium sp.]RWB66311.1 MAG: aminopeptidase P family protein [Mesorhizobium sp.]
MNPKHSQGLSRAAGLVPAMRVLDSENQVDMRSLRKYRLERVKEQLRKRDVGLMILTDPISIRYATGYRNWALFQTHCVSYYVFISPDGPTFLFGYSAKEPPLETIDECRVGAAISHFNAGPHMERSAAKFANDVISYLKAHGAGSTKIAIEQFTPSVSRELVTASLTVIDASPIVETARVIKSADEVLCMNFSIAVAEAGVARMREACKPGITEEELWALLHETNIAKGGEWIEARLLASGDRTNPWGQEASSRIISAGELVAFDTDMIGPFGYCADISRTFFCGPGKPTEEQRNLYKLAYEEIQHNTSIIRPGVTFYELSQKCFKLPDQYIGNRYSCLCHGLGLCDEYPKIAHPADWEARGYDGIVEEGMVLCVESYVGAAGGNQGVKLEEQILVTSGGYRLLSKFPFEESLLA